MLTLPFRTLIKSATRKGLQPNLLFRRGKSATIDPKQEAALNEKCFLVNNEDKVIGHATKRECHQVQKDGCIPLHRAFSVFLFNKKGDLLLQKRAAEKVCIVNQIS